MGDLEEDDWESAPVVPLAAAAAAGGSGKGTADPKRFDDEEEEEPEEEPKHNVVKPQPKKKVEKSWMKAEAAEADVPLDDPLAEKMRQQRLIEQADYAAAKELFGGGSGINLHTFLPKSVKDFEDFASEIVQQFFIPHKDNKNYKVLVKAMVRKACEPMTSAETKDVEAACGVVRLDKTKAEQAAKPKAAVKKSLNIGKAGLAAGLDDYQYDDAGDADDDFM
uniref:Eukaryotic translation initiation factor 3 30 kDa subunit n=1 Tax=Chlamydomonas euryale TaxID=1486919 RepID=A0A7R9V7L7_9CHLO